MAETEATNARPLARAIEGAAAVDPAATAVAKAVRGALDPGPVKDALGGTWLGHAVHPVLTDTVIGTWLSALVLDATGRDAAATERLIAAGVVRAVPTAVTGATDWADAEPAYATAVERGPASRLQPAFDAREREGRIELRRKPAR